MVRERLEEGAMSEATVEMKKNPCVSAPNVTAQDMRLSGWVDDKVESRTWCLGFGRVGGGGR